MRALRLRGVHHDENHQPTERTIIPTNNKSGPPAAARPAPAETLAAPSLVGTRLERRSNGVLAPSKGEGQNP
jgi:hypothetical protein